MRRRFALAGLAVPVAVLLLTLAIGAQTARTLYINVEVLGR